MVEREKIGMNMDAATTPELVCGIDELRAEAGEVDWAANKDEPHWVETFARSVSEGRLLRAGVVPDTYTAKTVCKSCGEVPVPPGWGSTVNNCRWCFVGGYK